MRGQRFVFSSVLVVLLLPAAEEARLRAVDDSERLPITGKAVPRLKQLDQVMLEIVRDNHLPGASLAIARDGKLVFAHGYGWADRADKKPVRPSSRFNLASCSKPITASAILKLADERKLRLDDKVLDLLDDMRPPAGSKFDPRLREVTIRQLLHHAGGIVRDHAPNAEVARRLNVELPVTLTQSMPLSLSKPLLFAPGTEAKYSNLGDLLCRLVVAHVSGQEYETFTAEHVLGPMGIRGAHLDLPEGYHPNEVRRYHRDGKALPGGHGPIKGGAGSWVLSPTEAMRFMTALDGSRGARVVSQQAYMQMLAPLPSLGAKRKGRHNGMFWDAVERSGSGVLYVKNGGVPGIATWVEHMPDGVCWAAFFNGNLKDAKSEEDEAEAPKKQAGKSPWPLIRQAIQHVEHWPTIDLFEAEEK